MEQSWNQVRPEPQNIEKKTPLRLRAMVGLELKILGKIQTHGREHLLEIPPGKKVIIVASHISDIDMPVIIGALGEDFDMKITSKSSNLDGRDSFGSLGPLAAGKENFLPVDYGKRLGGKTLADFNPENFRNMAVALNEGKEVLIAGHNPSSGTLPRGGIGASYLYQLGGGEYVIVPVAVNVKSEKPYRAGDEIALAKERPDADVFIGKPLSFDPIEHFDSYQKIMEKKYQGEPLTEEEIETSRSVRHQLMDNSDIVMESLAENLPEEKRGYYKNTASA